MADLFDYLAWRGDLSFLNSPANEADYYLISKIGCQNFDFRVRRNFANFFYTFRKMRCTAVRQIIARNRSYDGIF